MRAGLHLLAVLKVPCWRINVGMIPNGRGGFRRSLMVGMSDVIAVVDGIFLGLEFKTDTGRLTEAQAAFGERVTQGGGVYAVVRSVEDVEAAVERARMVARRGRAA